VRWVTGLASGVVVMKIDGRAVRARRWSVALSASLRGVDERLGERDAVRDVVRTAGPLESGGVLRGTSFTVTPSPASLLLYINASHHHHHHHPRRCRRRRRHTIRYNKNLHFKNWQTSCQFALAYELKTKKLTNQDNHKLKYTGILDC